MPVDRYFGDFIGVDEDALGDGVDHTQPADTALQQRLWSNTLNIAANPRMIAWSPLISKANTQVFNNVLGIRPYSLANDWLTVWAGLIRVMPKDRGVELYMIAHVHDIEPETTTPGQMRARLKVDGLGVRSNIVLDDSFDGGGNLDVRRYRLQLLFDEPFRGDTAELHTLEFAVKSEFVDQIGSGSSAIGYNGFDMKDYTAGGGGRFFSNGATGPSINSLECTTIELQTYGSDRTQYVRMLGVDDFGAKNADNTEAWLLDELQNSLGTTEQVFKRSTMYLAPRCFGFRMLRDREAVGQIPQAAFKPNETFESGSVIRQVRAIQKLARERRLVLMGPREGGDPASSSSRFFADYYDNPLEYRMCWPFIMGDSDGSVGTGTPIVQETLTLTTEGTPTIEVVMWVLVVSHGTRVNTTGIPNKLSLGDKKPEIEGDLTPGRTKWSIRVGVDQLDAQAAAIADWDTDTTSYGVNTSTRNFRTYGSYREAPEPILRGLEINWQRQGGGDGFWFREGSLIPEFGDFNFLEPLTIRVPLSNVTATNSARPFRLTINVDHEDKDDTDVNDYYRDAAEGLTGPSARVRFTIGAFQVYEIPG